MESHPHFVKELTKNETTKPKITIIKQNDIRNSKNSARDFGWGIHFAFQSFFQVLDFIKSQFFQINGITVTRIYETCAGPGSILHIHVEDRSFPFNSSLQNLYILSHCSLFRWYNKICTSQRPSIGLRTHVLWSLDSMGPDTSSDFRYNGNQLILSLRECLLFFK